MIVLIDNYDSFVYNLSRYCQELGKETYVVRADEIDADGVRELKPEAILISPGPCTPHEAGNSLSIVQELAGTHPILGVCLGHQVIAAAAGAKIVRAAEPVHGRVSLVKHASTQLFSDVPNPFQATRYHSLIVNEDSLPSDYRITARTDDGVPMAIEHVKLPVVGLQFHPESILTDCGHRLLCNFFEIANVDYREQAVSELPHPDIRKSLSPPAPVHTPGPVSLG